MVWAQLTWPSASARASEARESAERTREKSKPPYRRRAAAAAASQSTRLSAKCSRSMFCAHLPSFRTEWYALHKTAKENKAGISRE